jgi:hypothetical protein
VSDLMLAFSIEGLPKDGFFFSGHDGRLVNKKVENLDEAGAAIASEDEVYVCAAKRYFYYFTGIDVEVGDIGDPQNPITLDPYEAELREAIIQMGKSLKDHQDPRKTIRSILEHPSYWRSDFGVN